MWGCAARDCQDRNRVIEMTVERDDGGDICRIFPGRWVGESRGRNSSFSQARPPSRSGIAARLLLPRASLSRTAAEGASMPGGWRCDGIKHVAEMEVEDAANAAVAFAAEASVLERDV